MDVTAFAVEIEILIRTEAWQSLGKKSERKDLGKQPMAGWVHNEKL